jgi:superoxide reductase
MGFFNNYEMKPSDKNNLVKFEKKHIPEIVIGKKDSRGFTTVEIFVGTDGVVHPTEDNHWIHLIELHTDLGKVGYTKFDQFQSSGYGAFKVKLDGIRQLKAIASCNLHGVWSSEKSV